MWCKTLLNVNCNINTVNQKSPPKIQNNKEFLSIYLKARNDSIIVHGIGRQQLGLLRLKNRPNKATTVAQDQLSCLTNDLP